MKVVLTIDVPDEMRRALRRNWNMRGLATRREIRAEIGNLISAHWDDVTFDAERDEQETPQ